VTGPLEVITITFPGTRFKDEIMSTLASAVEHRTIRVIDLIFISKDLADAVTRHELDELEPALFGVVDDTTGSFRLRISNRSPTA
jgi:hypothetical protein